MRKFFALFSIVFLLSTCSESVSSQDTADVTSLGTAKVLFVGNSYTYGNNVPKLVNDLALSAGYDFHRFLYICQGANKEEN